MKTSFALILFIAAIIGNGQAQTLTTVISTDVIKLIDSQDKWVVLDVRTPGEYQAGHLKGAINLDINNPATMPEIEKLDRNAKYIVYCRTKNRSGVIANRMVELGFKVVYQMTDGMVGWSQNNLPVEK